jgi:ketosteroid isomerase-like protein
MNISAMLKTFCDAVERRDGKAFADLFTEDGVYHDVFYGAFEGRAKIAELIDDWFYRTASDFRWDMHSPVSDGETLYARSLGTAGSPRHTRHVRGRRHHETPRRQDPRIPRGRQHRP